MHVPAVRTYIPARGRASSTWISAHVVCPHHSAPNQSQVTGYSRGLKQRRKPAVVWGYGPRSWLAWREAPCSGTDTMAQKRAGVCGCGEGCLLLPALCSGHSTAGIAWPTGYLAERLELFYKGEKEIFNQDECLTVFSNTTVRRMLWTCISCFSIKPCSTQGQHSSREYLMSFPLPKGKGTLADYDTLKI